VALRRGEGYRVPRAQVCFSGPGQAGCMFYFRPISIESSVIFVCVCVPCRPCRGPMSHAATGARFGFWRHWSGLMMTLFHGITYFVYCHQLVKTINCNLCCVNSALQCPGVSVWESKEEIRCKIEENGNADAADDRETRVTGEFYNTKNVLLYFWQRAV